MNKNKITISDVELKNAINDLNDFEVQAIVKKYSKKSLNPFRNKTNNKLMIDEVTTLLINRKNEEIEKEKLLQRNYRQELLNDAIVTAKDSVKKHQRLFTILGSIVLIAFAGSFLFKTYQSMVKDVSFAFSDDHMYVGDYLDLEYIVNPSTAKVNEDDISILFSNDNLVEYDSSKNQYRFVKEGYVTIKLLYKNKEYDSKTIDVDPVLIESIYYPDIEIGRGNSLTVNPIIKPDNATNKEYIVTVDDNSILSIDANNITGNKVGQTVLHINSIDGFSYDIDVNVIEIEPTKITIKGIGNEYIVQDEASATIDYYPSYCTLRDVTWRSSNTRVATVDSEGNIVARDKGTAIISAYYNNSVTDQMEITVDYPLPSLVKINDTYSSITEGNTIKLSTSLNPSKVSDSTIKWSSSNSKVAEVDEYGRVTGKSEGSVKITATTANGLTDSVNLEIKARPVIAVAPVITNSGNPTNRTTTSGSITYVLNTSTRKFHRPSCGHLPTTNRQDTTASRDEVIGWGYVPCKKCNP